MFTARTVAPGWQRTPPALAEAARELGLEPGVQAVAVVKATTVVVETPRDRA